MTGLRLKPASAKKIDLLLPLVKAYHEFERVQLSDQERRNAVDSLLANSALGQIWLIEKQKSSVGYIAMCFG